MSNGEVCCLLGVCCPPSADSSAQMEAMETFLQSAAADGASDKKGRRMIDIREASKVLTETFDFALKGTLTPLVSAVLTQYRQSLAHKAEDEPESV